jgi:hypothetical protein
LYKFADSGEVDKKIVDDMSVAMASYDGADLKNPDLQNRDL